MLDALQKNPVGAEPPHLVLALEPFDAAVTVEGQDFARRAGSARCGVIAHQKRNRPNGAVSTICSA